MTPELLDYWAQETEAREREAVEVARRHGFVIADVDERGIPDEAKRLLRRRNSDRERREAWLAQRKAERRARLDVFLANKRAAEED